MNINIGFFTLFIFLAFMTGKKTQKKILQKNTDWKWIFFCPYEYGCNFFRILSNYIPIHQFLSSSKITVLLLSPFVHLLSVFPTYISSIYSCSIKLSFVYWWRAREQLLPLTFSLMQKYTGDFFTWIDG